MKNYLLILGVFLLFQTIGKTQTLPCGTVSSKDSNFSYQAFVQFARQFQSVTSIPIRFHIMRQSGGTGKLPILTMFRQEFTRFMWLEKELS